MTEWRRPAWRPITIAVVVLLGVAAVLATTFDPEQPSALAGGWEVAEVDPFEGVDEAGMSDVVASTEALIAVGHVRRGEEHRPAVWRSTDGHRWTPIASPSFGERGAGGGGAVMAAISSGEQLTVAAGWEGSPSEPGPVAFWVSTDEGRTWERLAHDDEVFVEGRIEDVTTSEDGSWVAVGSVPAGSGEHGEAWRSPDGRVWERLSPGPVADGTEVSLNVVTTGGDGLVALGADPGTGPGADAPVWTSTDGTSWRQVRMPPDLLDTSAAVRDAIPWRQDGLMAAADEGSGGGSRVAVLSRLDTDLDDATAWRTATIPGGPVHAAGLLDAGDGHIVLVGWEDAQDGPHLAVWSTRDGATWEPIEAPGLQGEAAEAVPSAITTNGTNTVIVGTSADGRPVAWVHGDPS